MINTGRLPGTASHNSGQQALCKQLHEHRAAMERQPNEGHAERYAHSVQLALASPQCAVRQATPQAPEVQAMPRRLGAWSLLAPLPTQAFQVAAALVDTTAAVPVVPSAPTPSWQPPLAGASSQSLGRHGRELAAMQADNEEAALQEEAEAVLLAGLDILRRHRLLHAWQQAAQQPAAAPSVAVRQIARAFGDKDISEGQQHDTLS